MVPLATIKERSYKMDINRANIEDLFYQFKVEFTDAFNAARTTVRDEIAMFLPSTSSSTKHAWLNQIPQIREWLGDRFVNNLESDNMTIENKKYESTIELTREEIEDNEHGLYTPLVRLMGQNAAVFSDKLLVDELIGSPTWAADAAAFFGDSRTYGSSTIDNLVASALSEANFQTAWQQQTSFTGHNGEPLEVTPTTLLVGPSLRQTGFDILQNEFRAVSNGPIKNSNVGLASLQVSKRLVGAHAAKWFLFGEVAGIRGAAYQERIAPEFQGQRATPDSDFAFAQDKYQYGTRQRGRAFLTLPHLIIGGNL